MSEVTKIQDVTQPDQAVTVSQEDPMMALIEKVILTPDLPMERIQAALDIRERQMDKTAEQAFNAAFAASMAEMPDVPRTGVNKHLKRTYSTLDDLIRASRPALSRHGLSLNWETGIDGEKIRVKAIVRHALGHSISTEQSAARDKSGSMNQLQGGGSTETYLKRYTGFAILGLASGDEADDDGQGQAPASKTVSAEQYVKLRDKLAESGFPEDQFHSAFGHDDPANADLHQFPAARFQEAMTRLENYASKKAAQT